jgi:hypothetical protein
MEVPGTKAAKKILKMFSAFKNTVYTLTVLVTGHWDLKYKISWATVMREFTVFTIINYFIAII